MIAGPATAGAIAGPASMRMRPMSQIRTPWSPEVPENHGVAEGVQEEGPEAYFLDDPRPFTRSPKIDTGRLFRNRPPQEVSGRRASATTLALGGHRALEAWPTAPPPYLRGSDLGSDGGRPRGHVNAAAHDPRELPRTTSTLLPSNRRT
jgi:hypothetical protein